MPDLPYTIDDIRRLCAERKILFKDHATQRMLRRGIKRKDVFDCIMNGEIIEKYPSDKPFPSCLIMSASPLHVVCSTDFESIYIITAYKPNTLIFDNDYKTRRKQK
ncbi:MAG: DUF4258 domain-containing protein [Firmicutes bacterium]|nr:DUF4258 domain-containing protein [Bacillota bacterium]